MSETSIPCSIACEGDVDGVVATRILKHVGLPAASIYVARGKDRLKAQLAGYNQAARRSPWFVLVDLNRKLDCAPRLRREWLPSPSSHMCFRVAVRTVESWMMADAERLARFLSLSPSLIPRKPDMEMSPKEMLVNLARRSSRREIREDMVPREGSGRSIGNAFNARLIEFAARQWRPAVASRRSESLRRCLQSVKRLA
jgi:hypothetical protein